MIFLRILSFLFLMLSAVFFPPVVTILIFILLAVYFCKFFEGVLAGVFLDAFYLSPAIFEKFNIGFFTITFFMAVLLFGELKHYLKDKSQFSKFALLLSGFLFFSICFLFFKF